MASLLRQGNRFYCQFMYHGKRHCFALGQVGQAEAEAKVSQTDYLLLRLRQGLLQDPADTDIVTFLQFDGKRSDEAPAARGGITLGKLRDRYLEDHRGSLESTTVAGIELHFTHLTSLLGERFPLKTLNQDTLQTYATKRSQLKWRGELIRSATIKKEIVSLRTAWNWGVGADLISGKFPSLRKIRVPKTAEKPPFQTWQEIDRRVSLGGLTQREIDELWDGLFLRQEEVTELLEYVKQKANLPWIYPCFCTACPTGARRSELLRIQVADVDLDTDTLLIRKKKRAHDRTTTRRVSMSPFLKKVLEEWLAIHPGGPNLFCHPREVVHSKKRSPTTGHNRSKNRQTTTSGRLANVQKRAPLPSDALTRNEVHDHFKRTLSNSKWAAIPGWHCFRHSFISLCASRGIDQRVIDEWVGPQTEEQRRRYRHLYPDVKQEAIKTVFG